MPKLFNEPKKWMLTRYKFMSFNWNEKYRTVHTLNSGELITNGHDSK